MKTKKLINKEAVVSSNLIMLIGMILFCKILLLANGSGESRNSSAEINKPEFLMPIQQKIFSNTVTPDLEKEKLFQNINLKEKAVNCENEKIVSKEADAEFSMEKMNAYLINEAEPALELELVQLIVFPDLETVEFNAEYEIENDIQLAELKAEALAKTKADVEIYAFEKKIRDYLIVEKEESLELEDWMTDAKCWCPELRETMALAEQK
ncbi:MAG TPA: hypothetical protein VLA03_01065 [Draconibacterium sp.]|nr:hypothetical protein [Draconibacterium sp.]